MSLAVRLLGTSAARPTVERNVSALAIVREGETLLVDCGEGTQRQMMRYGISFALNDIFFTHFHTDHLLGLLGLVRTMALQGRTEPLRLWGPRGAARVIKRTESLGLDHLSFPLQTVELSDGDRVERSGYDLYPFSVDHGGAPAIGYALVEETRKGRFDPDKARELGIPEGPLWGRIHRGEAITLDDGTVIASSALVGPSRAGRTVVVTGDTRPCAATIEHARNADLLIHEATFANEEAERAVETGHSTASEAAAVAKAAVVRQLVLTHISARYSADAKLLEREARVTFPNVAVGRDGMEIDVPFLDA